MRVVLIRRVVGGKTTAVGETVSPIRQAFSALRCRREYGSVGGTETGLILLLVGTLPCQ